MTGSLGKPGKAQDGMRTRAARSSVTSAMIPSAIVRTVSTGIVPLSITRGRIPGGCIAGRGPPWIGRESIEKMHSEVPEALQHEQFSWSGFAVDVLVFQAPGGVVRNEHRIEPDRQRRVDVRLRRVADHPGPRRIDLQLRHKTLVGRGVL